jgi:archaellum component FlaC
LNEVKTLQIKSDLLIAELRLSAAKQEELLKKVNDLQSQLSALLTQIATLNKQLENQNADVQLIKNKLSELETQYLKIFKQLEELQKLSQILAEIEKMKTQITQLDTRYNTILSGLAQNKEQLDALKTQITTVQTQLAENLTKITQLTSQLGAQGVVIGTILKQIESLKNSNAEIIKLLETLLFGKSPVPTNGLVGWWPFNGNANDESGNGNNGVVKGASLSKDRFGNQNSSYFFPSKVGAEIIVKNKDIYNFNSEFSISIRANYKESWSYANESLIYKGTFPFVSGWELGVNQDDSGYGNGKYRLQGSLTKGNGAVSAGQITDFSQLNQWNHYLMTFSNNILKLYLNGNLINSISILNPIINNSFDISIGGCINSNVGARFNKELDDIAIWNRALSADEISKIFAGQGF